MILLFVSIPYSHKRVEVLYILVFTENNI